MHGIWLRECSGGRSKSNRSRNRFDGECGDQAGGGSSGAAWNFVGGRLHVISCAIACEASGFSAGISGWRRCADSANSTATNGGNRDGAATASQTVRCAGADSAGALSPVAATKNASDLCIAGTFFGRFRGTQLLRRIRKKRNDTALRNAIDLFLRSGDQLAVGHYRSLHSQSGCGRDAVRVREAKNE